MNDELDLTQFKDLIGELDGKTEGFSLDDILKEDFSRTAEPVQTETVLTQQDMTEQAEQEETSYDDSEADILEENGTEYSDDYVEEIDGEYDTAVFEDTEDETRLFDKVLGGTYDDELEDVTVDENDRFEEKKPKRSFWEKWLAPEPLEEDSAEYDEEPSEEITEYVGSESLQEEPTEFLEGYAAENNEYESEEDENIEESEQDFEEVSAPSIKKPAFISKWFSPIDEENAEDTEPEETEQEELPIEEECVVEEAVKETDITETDEEKPAETEQEITYEEPTETEEETEQPYDEEETESEPIISEAEFESFMKEHDNDEGGMLSFEQLMQESGIDTDKAEPVFEEVEEIVNAEENFEEKFIEVNIERMQEEVLEKNENKAKTEQVYIETEQEEPHISKYKAREFPAPKWIDMPLDKISEIAPKEVRLTDEPVLMNEVHRLENEREQERLRQEAAMRAAEPQPQPESQQRIFVPSENTATDDGGDDEVSGQNISSDDMQDIPQDTADKTINETEDSEQPEKNEPVYEDNSKTVEQSEEDDFDEEDDEPEVHGFRGWKERREQRRIKREMPKSANAGLKQWNKRAKSIGKRSVIVLVLAVLAIYLSCSATMNLPVPKAISFASDAVIFYSVLIGLAVAAFIAAADIVADAFKAVLRLQPDFSTLVVLNAIVSVVHCIVKMNGDGEDIAYIGIAIIALFFLMRARTSQALARRNTYKAANMNTTPVGVFIHKGKVPHLVKRRLEDNSRFVYSAAKDGWHSMYERLYSPIAIMVSVVLAIVVSAASKDFGRFVYVFSAMLTSSCQIGVIVAVAYGCANTTRRLIQDHAAIAGLSAAVRISGAPQAAMTEEDLFPAGSITVDDYVDIRNAMDLDDVLAYAEALEGESSLGNVFREKLRRRYAERVSAHDIIHYANGNQGCIDDREIIFGTSELMKDRKIPIPALPNEEDHMFLAVDGKTAAVFEIRYTATTQVYTALQTLSERKISILLKKGDCYLSDEQLCDLFGLKPGTIHRADDEHSHVLNSPDYTDDDALLAILTRDGAAAYADCADAACKMSRYISIGMLLGTAGAVIELLLMSYLCYVFAPLAASPIRALVYSLIWALPIFYIENEVKQS